MMEIPCVTSKKRKNSSSMTSFQQAKTPRRCLSPSSDHDSFSSCSSSLSPDLEEETGSGSVIVEVEASICYSERERKSETTSLSDSSSENLDSSREKAVNSHLRSKKKKEKMPTESELEDFFAQAEKNLHKQFANKYNFDVVKDVALEGRYEWLKLKQ